SGTQTLTATVAGLAPVEISATIATLTVVSGNSQLRLEGNAFTDPLGLRLADAFATAIPGKEVTFTLDNGATAGSLAIGANSGITVTGTTNASGEVSAVWTAADVASTNVEALTVSVGNLSVPMSGTIQVP